MRGVSKVGIGRVWRGGGHRWKRGKSRKMYKGLKVRERFGESDGEENDLLGPLPASMGLRYGTEEKCSWDM